MTNGFSVGARLPLLLLLAALAVGVSLGRSVAEVAPAHADAARSRLAAGWFARHLTVEVALDRPVPFRVFTLDGEVARSRHCKTADVVLDDPGTPATANLGP